MMRILAVLLVSFIRPLVLAMSMVVRASTRRLDYGILRFGNRIEPVRMMQATSEQDMHGQCRKGQYVYHSMHGRLALHERFQGTCYSVHHYSTTPRTGVGQYDRQADGGASGNLAIREIRPRRSLRWPAANLRKCFSCSGLRQCRRAASKLHPVRIWTP